jgi:integrase
LREGENRGCRWERYDGKQIQVAKSVWRGNVKNPKSRASKAPVPVIAPLAERLNAYRKQCGSPESGWMFPNSVGNPRCLDELARLVIRPAFEKAEIPWHGWHAFRRGLATNLHRLGVPDKVIQIILRHANLSVTQNSYIKVVQPEAVDAMNKLEHATDEQMKRARKPAPGAGFNEVAAAEKSTYATTMQPYNDGVRRTDWQSNVDDSVSSLKAAT